MAEYGESRAAARHSQAGAAGGTGFRRRVLSRRTAWIAVPLILVGLVVTVAEVGGATGPAQPSPATPRLPAPSPATPGRATQTAAVRTFSQWYDEAEVKATTRAQWATIARRNAVVVLNSWDYQLIPVLRRANPHVQVWVYKNLSGVRSDDCVGDCGDCTEGITDSNYLSSGMGYCWLKRNHPDWLLSAAGTGQPFAFRHYPRIWEADYGNLAYQRQWIRNVLADVRGHGWDGVEVDNVLTIADAYGVAAKYPTDAAVQAAAYSALREVGPALHNAGVASVFNVGYATRFPGLWQRWLSAVYGLEQQYYLSYSTHPDAFDARWSMYQDEVSSCAAQHKTCWFHAGEDSPAVTSQTRGYALASYLLAADSGQLLAVGSSTQQEPLTPHWGLGAPLGTMYQMAGAWARYFTRGIAVVNPSRSSSTVFLGGTYLDSAGHKVGVVTLGPTSGAVLRAAPG